METIHLLSTAGHQVEGGEAGTGGGVDGVAGVGEEGGQ